MICYAKMKTEDYLQLVGRDVQLHFPPDLRNNTSSIPMHERWYGKLQEHHLSVSGLAAVFRGRLGGADLVICQTPEALQAALLLPVDEPILLHTDLLPSALLQGHAQG